MIVRRSVIYFMFVFVVSCTHAAFTDELLPIINLSKAEVRVGDSVLVSAINAGDNPKIQLMPNLGEIQNNGWYKTPSTVLVNGTTVTFSLFSNNNIATTKIVIQKADVNDTAISFNQTIMPLLVANCNFNGCHGSGSSAGKTNLSNYAEVLKHVTIFQPQKSILYTSLLKPDALRRMPPAGPLHLYKINWVLKWIEQGALDK